MSSAFACGSILLASDSLPDVLLLSLLDSWRFSNIDAGLLPLVLQALCSRFAPRVAKFAGGFIDYVGSFAVLNLFSSLSTWVAVGPAIFGTFPRVLVG